MALFPRRHGVLWDFVSALLPALRRTISTGAMAGHLMSAGVALVAGAVLVTRLEELYLES
jgi:hypothetical protein